MGCPQNRSPEHPSTGGAFEAYTVSRSAVAAIDAARNLLARYALSTDWPATGVVEAADLLDAARALLGGDQ